MVSYGMLCNDFFCACVLVYVDSVILCDKVAQKGRFLWKNSECMWRLI